MAESARDLVRKLGTFLADVTQDRPADRIHAEILDRLRDASLPLDHRLAGVYLQDKDFVPIWTAIRNGASLPASSWETLVLPTVVHYSTEQAVKGNLEIAIVLWRAARDALSVPLPIEAAVIPTPPAPAPTPAFEEPPPEPEIIPWGEPEPAAGAPRRRMRLWVPSAAGLTLVAVAAVVLVNFPEPAATPGPLPSSHVFPDPPKPSPVPSEEPSPSPSAEPTATAMPAAPTTSAMRTVSPTAPRSLTSTAKTRTSVSLAWQAPAEPGTGGLDRYRVYVNGQEFQATTTTAATIINLTPGTNYTFTVKAFSRMGRESPASTITVRTDDPAFSAPPSVLHGQGFDISGAGWPCAIVDVHLGPHLVVRPKTDAGAFTDTIYVGPDGMVTDFYGTSFELTPGTWQIRASCAGLNQPRTLAVAAKSVDPPPPET